MIQLRIPVVVLIIGVIVLIAGIAIAISAPNIANWEPKGEILATQKPISVSAGWKSQSESFLDEVITVGSFETFDYWFASKPFILEEAKNFEITGTAIEQSSSQLYFNFYVFDSVNFDLWKAEAPYTAYHEAEGSTSYDFSFSIADEESVPSMFYFVVEEYTLSIKPTVRITATIKWVEKCSIYDCTDYFMSWQFLFTFEESKDFVLQGSVTEATNKKFDFYIFDSANYFDWIGSKSYSSCYEAKNITTASFSVPLSKEEATSIFYFVVENPLLDTNETVNLSATMEWKEKATIATTIGGWILGGAIAFIGFIIIIIAGVVALVLKPKAPESTPPLPPPNPPV